MIGDPQELHWQNASGIHKPTREFLRKDGFRLDTYLIPSENRNTYFGKTKRSFGRLNEANHWGNGYTFAHEGSANTKFPRNTKCYKCNWDIEYCESVLKVYYRHNTRYYHTCCYKLPDHVYPLEVK